VTAKKKPITACKIYLTDRALADLVEVEAFSIVTWGKAVAAKYLLKFEKAFRLLESNPDLARANPELGTDLLLFRVEKHLLACIQVKGGLAILTVAHASRDLENVLNDLSPTLKLEVNALVKKIESRK
jgi:plasmid stabilization system protein ParE